MVEQSALSYADGVTDPDVAVKIIHDSVLRLWDVVNDLTRLRPPRLSTYNATIFGSARVGPGQGPYEDVKRLAADLAKMGATVITGGGPGLMQAANEGAASVCSTDSSCSVGIRIHLPFEQGVNAFVGQMYEHKTFFSRLHQFVMLSDAFICVPGGIGTLLELSIVWQLLQVEKLRDTPLILVGPMWRGLIDWAQREMVEAKPAMASPRDTRIPQCVDTADEAIAILRQHHARWVAAGETAEPPTVKPNGAKK